MASTSNCVDLLKPLFNLTETKWRSTSSNNRNPSRESRSFEMAIPPVRSLYLFIEWSMSLGGQYPDFSFKVLQELIADMARWALKGNWSLFVANQGLPTW
ncbi:hypothetical protein COLO4_07626 [Corchorus olitorius]|uniref:Uncharacterized protein n=1 Tax=Corchorus olitorius TaxID=93759 RepID=A0A1R3KJ44_9ROSI|nr:hypothetical protein COLO4_07626 [Corchorus olitorius]